MRTAAARSEVTGRVRRLVVLAVLPLLLAVCGQTTTTSRPSKADALCRVDGSLVKLARVPEASGVAVSRRMPGRFWTHNDSGQPVLFMFDARGALVGRLRLTGATVVDWEAVSAGPCPSGDCLYVADIGDNNATRRQITVYRLTEPADVNAATATAEAFHARYPDGPHDAETLLVAADGSLYIVTKGSAGPVAIYRFPRDLHAGEPPVELERIGQPRSSGRVRNDDQITDGAISADGARAVLRTHDALFFYPTAQLLVGNWSAAEVVSIKYVGEPQGEGVALGGGNAVYLVGEGGGGGTFASLTCGR